MKPTVVQSFGRAIVVSVLMVTCTLAQSATTRPSIVYVVAADLGWKDVGFHGSDIATPNIDKLAATGARLEQFCAQPIIWRMALFAPQFETCYANSFSTRLE